MASCNALDNFLPFSASPWFMSIINRCRIAPCRSRSEEAEWEIYTTSLLKEDMQALLEARDWLLRNKITLDSETDMLRLLIQVIWLGLMNMWDIYSEVVHHGQCGHVTWGLIGLNRECPLSQKAPEDPEETGNESRQNLTSRNGAEWFSKVSENPYSLLLRWVNVLETFFGTETPTEIAELEAVQVLREMRQVSKRQGYVKRTLAEPIRKTGLARLILKISNPSTWLERKSEKLGHSFRRYQWKESLLLCLQNLTPEFIPLDPDMILELRETCGEGDNMVRRLPLQVLRSISEHELLPLLSNPYCIFFLSSEENFITACLDWLIASLQEVCETPFLVGHIKQVFQSICRLRIEDIYKLELSETMTKILELSLKLRNDRKLWKQLAHNERNRNKGLDKKHCVTCGHLRPEERCVQYIQVIKTDLSAQIAGKMVVPDPGDALKPSKQTQCNATIPLQSLGLRPVRLNREILQRCGRFVVHLQEEESKSLVGGIQFDFLMEDEASRLENNQAKLKRLMKLSRGKRFNQWQHGEMRAIGSRLPAGGRLGDGYGPYPGVIVTSTADIETLFSHASDLECLLAKVEPHAPHVTQELKIAGKEAKTFGSYGLTAYHCWNYMAPQHCDNDATWTLSYQLKKINCQRDEFQFVFAHWGVVLETETNCVWWFRGDHLHGTVAPRPRTLKTGQCLSQGVVVTLPAKTYAEAKKYAQARWSWSDLCKVWGADGSYNQNISNLIL